NQVAATAHALRYRLFAYSLGATTGAAQRGFELTGDGELPEDVVALLRTSIATFEELEVLQAMQRQPERHWSVTDLSQWVWHRSRGRACGAWASGGRGAAPGGPRGG